MGMAQPGRPCKEGSLQYAIAEVAAWAWLSFPAAACRLLGASWPLHLPTSQYPLLEESATQVGGSQGWWDEGAGRRGGGEGMCVHGR
jgi:hypothetical protein